MAAKAKAPESKQAAGMIGRVGAVGAYWGVKKCTFRVINSASVEVRVIVGTAPFCKELSGVSVAGGYGGATVQLGVTFEPSKTPTTQEDVIMYPGKESVFSVAGSAGLVTLMKFSLEHNCWLIYRKDRQLSNGEKYVIRDTMINTSQCIGTISAALLSPPQGSSAAGPTAEALKAPAAAATPIQELAPPIGPVPIRKLSASTPSQITQTQEFPCKPEFEKASPTPVTLQQTSAPVFGGPAAVPMGYPGHYGAAPPGHGYTGAHAYPGGHSSFPGAYPGAAGLPGSPIAHAGGRAVYAGGSPGSPGAHPGPVGYHASPPPATAAFYAAHQQVHFHSASELPIGVSGGVPGTPITLPGAHSTSEPNLPTVRNFCGNCGRPLQGYAFCGYCGTRQF